jgi:polysaccharide deacetylase family sporulation protein PdaB
MKQPLEVQADMTHRCRFKTGIFALFCTISLLWAGNTAQATHMSDTGAIYKVDTHDKVVALTFDISWGEKMPGPVLAVLRAKGVNKATFFLSGPWVLHHPDIAKRIHAMGFEIGSHGYMHRDFSGQSDNWIRSQMEKSKRSLQDVLSITPKLVRTPNGDFDKRVLRVLHELGYTVIQWNTDSLDWMNPGAERIRDRVLRRVTPGDIILLHASDSCKQTHIALPQIIDGLRAKGYRFATVSELITGAQSKTQVQ